MHASDGECAPCSVLASEAWRNSIGSEGTMRGREKYRAGRYQGDAGRQRGEHQESVTLCKRERIKRRAGVWGLGGEIR
ncbi:hypothetical protein K0M31_016382 [Melipona bicolor]|uniref:Uncharacterized protein n=1 Tax=Melipona bicolor TaxID=60889 RepID=A0AA40G712_9HYME|nr:hypothetical protein K0M31_016382 [Melipona bicolor]